MPLKNNDLESNREQLLKGFAMLVRCDADISTYIHNVEFIKFFDYLKEFSTQSYGEPKSVEKAEFFLKHDFHLQIIRLNAYFLVTCETLRHAASDGESGTTTKVFVSNQRVTNFLFAYSKRFRLKYMQHGGLRLLTELIANETFFKNFNDHAIYETLLMNICILSSDCDVNKPEWTRLHVVNILLSVARLNSKFKLVAYSAILKVITDDEIKSVPESDLFEVIDLFLKPLNEAANRIATTTDCSKLKREKKQFPDDDNDDKIVLHEVYMVAADEQTQKRTTALTSILNNFYKLAVNDSIKADLYLKYKLRDALRMILFKGSEIEKHYSFNILAQLCFDSTVLESVVKDTELVSCVEATIADKSSLKATVKYCQQILHSIDQQTRGCDLPTESVSNENQIMISYNSACRDMCLRIKSELEQAGYRISNTEEEASKFEAIEKSHIILICVTEAYRQSVNCQAEAQYAFKLKKPIVPLIMQKDYDKVGGWLSTIMSYRVYINFMEYSFDDAITRLLSHIQLINSYKEAARSVMSSNSNNCERESPPLDWNDDEVLEWCKTIETLDIYEHLRPCNGRLLHQLYKMRRDAALFYYEFITMKQKVTNQREILVFTENLEKIFS